VARVKVGPVFVIPGGAPGLVIRGNIDLTSRPIVRNADGSISTVRSVSWRHKITRGRPVDDNAPVGRFLEVLMPSVVGNRVISDRAADDHFLSTGQHLGMFDNVAHANAYSQRLHVWQAKFYAKYLKPRRR
jgi:hypothetical protein